MNTWVLLIVLAASVLAILLVYCASPYQRSLPRPLAAFPARVSAGLATIVALRGWIEALGVIAGISAWLTSAGAVAVLGYWLTTRAKAAARREVGAAELHSWNAR